MQLPLWYDALTGLEWGQNRVFQRQKCPTVHNEISDRRLFSGQTKCQQIAPFQPVISQIL
jgi:hypothetical protein